MLAVCNGQMYGGGYCAAPHASMADGLLDVVLLKPIPRLKLPACWAATKGVSTWRRRCRDRKIQTLLNVFRTSKIDIEVLDGNPLITTLDGECSPQLTMHAEAVRSATHILLPPPWPKPQTRRLFWQAMGE